MYKAAYGQHDAGWIAFYDAFRRIGFPDVSRLDGLTAVARSAGWWWPFAGAVILTDRPSVLRRDPDGRLHAEGGPALAYRDGWAIHAWHGVRVQPWVITDPTPERIAAETNVEVRRCAIESFGWERFVQAAELRMVGAPVPDPGNPGQYIALYEVPRRLWGDPVRVLLATNGSVERDGTRRQYGLTVPDTIADPVAAAGWTYGLSGDQYSQLARRT